MDRCPRCGAEKENRIYIGVVSGEERYCTHKFHDSKDTPGEDEAATKYAEQVASEYCDDQWDYWHTERVEKAFIDGRKAARQQAEEEMREAVAILYESGASIYPDGSALDENWKDKKDAFIANRRRNDG